MNKQHIGSKFDEFLREEGLLEVSQAMASRMKTSPAVLERLLDPANRSVTTSTLERAALALGKKLKVELA